MLLITDSMRKVRYTYGVEAVVRFDPNIHSEENKVTIAGRDGFWCKNYIDKFVSAGDSVAIDSFLVCFPHLHSIISYRSEITNHNRSTNNQ